MKLNKDHRKKIIIALLIAILMFSGRWVYKEWTLYQSLIGEKGRIMENHYHMQSMYLRDLEEITAKIIVTSEAPDKVKEDVMWLNRLYWGIKSSRGYNRYDYFKEKIEYRDLKEFIEISKRILNLYSSGRIKLNDKNMEVLKNINRKAKALNGINKNYYYDVGDSDLDTEDIFYSKLLVEAVNEMNDSLKEYPKENFDYEIYIDKENQIDEPKPEIIYGGNTVSEDEAKKIAEKFLGKEEFGVITEIFYEDEEDRVLRAFDIRTENDYELEIFGEKITELRYIRYDDSRDSEKNISREDALKKTLNFLSERGFDSLELIHQREFRGELEVSLAQSVGGYVNMAAEIDATIDLTRKGQLLELELSEYWKGLLYDDSGYDTALDGYEMARAALKQDIGIKEEKLVGRREEGYVLGFYWRFTTEFDGDDYYIYVDAVTGEEKYVSKILN